MNAVPFERASRVEPDIDWLDPNTVQLREPKASHVEAPFLYLLFGRDRALLLDSGATGDEAHFPIRGAVEGLLEEWLRRNPARVTRPFPLVVAHSHAHYDHVAGDALLAARPGTTVVGTTPAEVIAFFGFRTWPDETVTCDLGGRTLDVIGGPGHEPSAIALFDRATGILLTGDTVYPGRLYIDDEPQFRATVERLIRFRDTAPAPVRELRGAHIEMTRRPGVDYRLGAPRQRKEAPLPLPPGVLDEVLAALDEPGERVVRDRFILVRR